MTTKEKVLHILTEKNAPVSGEIIAQQCNVSRAAVWKAINSLRDEGFLIEGTTNGGYKFCGSFDIFSKNTFASDFYSAFPDYQNSHLECFKIIDSTNTYAKKILSECGNLRNPDETLTSAGQKYHKSIIVAESQTSGRGRLGRTFLSPQKTGIYLSIIFAPEGGIAEPAKLTAFSAVAVCRTLKKLFNIETQIKWVNDVFYKGKKIAGILTEGSVNFETKKIESAVIGIGLNLVDNDVFCDLEKTVGSVCGKNNCSITRSKIAAQIAGETLSILEDKSSDIIQEYRQLSFLTGKTIVVHPVIGDNCKSYSAKVLDIDDNASLVVEILEGENKGQTKILNSGEISIKSESFAQ